VLSRRPVARLTRDALASAALLLAAATCTPFGSDTEAKSGAGDSGADAGGAVLVREGASTGTSTTTLTVALPTRPADGHALVLVVASNKDYPSGVAGGGIASWINAAQAGAHVATEIWVGLGVSSATSDVTITWPAPQPAAVALLTEWAGLSALDSPGAAADGKTATPTVAPFAAQPAQLLFAVAGTQSLAAGPTNGFSAITPATPASNGSVKVVAAYLKVGSAGMYGTSWTMPSPAGWDTTLVALR
jgi:hypothetical protein